MKNLSEMGLLFNSFIAGYGQLKSVGFLEGLEVHRGIFINHLEAKSPNLSAIICLSFTLHLFQILKISRTWNLISGA